MEEVEEAQAQHLETLVKATIRRLVNECAVSREPGRIVVVSSLTMAGVLANDDIAAQEEGDLGIHAVGVLCHCFAAESTDTVLAVQGSECAVMTTLIVFHHLSFVQQLGVANRLMK